jgi:hypothetical protein
MKNGLIIASLVLLAGAAWADKVLDIDVDLYKDDTVKVNYIRIADGYATKFIAEGKYKLVIRDKNENVLRSIPLDPSFIMFTDPPIERDHATIGLRLDYSQEMKFIELYNAEKKIYSGSIAACDGDGKCETESESYLSCPRDCPLDKKDGLCTGGADGICDPDCAAGIDPDCNVPARTDPCNRDGVCESHAGETLVNCPEDCGSLPVEECVNEGDAIDTSGTQQCCAGLSAISCHRPDPYGKCPDSLCDSFPCAKCGNSVCGPGENVCNCPTDCVIVSTTLHGGTRQTSTLPASTTTLGAGGPAGSFVYMDILPYAVILFALIIAAYVIYKRKNKE